MTTQQVIGILISLTAVSSYINYRFIKLPKSIGITLVTLTLSLLIVVGGRLGWDADDFSKNLLNIIDFNKTFLHGMLSFLLFAGTLHVSVMDLAKYKSVVALLATVSVIISTFLVGYAMYGLTKLVGVNLPFSYCLVFGALISPTDPIAVMGVLRASNAPKALKIKITGEALFNDGVGIVLFVVALGIAHGTQESLSANTIALYSIREGVGGLLFGCIIGWLAAQLLKNIDDYEVAIIITLAIVTGGYSLAHAIDVSGPICVAVAGLVIGGYVKDGNMTRLTMQKLDSFWELLDEVLSAILFVLIGLEFININFSLDTTIAAMGAIIIVIIARWISVVVPVLTLARFRKFDFNTLMVMTWGGLRGGISIALALSLKATLAPDSPDYDFLTKIYDFVIAITYAVVLFSIMVQGVTISPLLRRMKRDSEAKQIEEDTEEQLVVEEEISRVI